MPTIQRSASSWWARGVYHRARIRATRWLCPPYELNTTSRSRDADRVRALLNFLSLARKEGAGNAGCLLHPRSRVQKCAKKAHTSIQVQTEQSGIPCAMALRLMPCSPRRRIRLVTVVDGLTIDRKPGWVRTTSASLTPATGAGPHGFAVRFSAVRLARLVPAHGKPPCDHITRPTLPRPPQPVPTFVTMANAPLSGTGWRQL